jgi:hypothetical protein
MAESPMRLIKRLAEFQPIENVRLVPPKRRGIYVLYRQDGENHFNVVYVGMARGGMQGRLKIHKRRKDGLWTHFSVYEVWDNIRDEEIVELEGLFRFIYRKDKKANVLNVQRNFKKAKLVRENSLRLWAQPGVGADRARSGRSGFPSRSARVHGGST